MTFVSGKLRRMAQIISFCILILLTPLSAFSENSVTVHWKSRFLNAQGAVIKISVPSANYLKRLQSCGFEANLSQQTDYVPVSVLRCPGVLDFSQSKAIRARIAKRIKAAIANGGRIIDKIPLSTLLREISSVDFAISPYGVFYSDLDSPGSKRFGGVNVAQSKLVIINEPFWEQMRTPGDLDALLIHEALGALGYDDSQYETSARLFLLSKEGIAGQDAKKVSGKKVAMSEGGASVVGRGGDPNAEIWKLSLLKLVEKKLAIEGVDPRWIPTKSEIRAVINRTEFLAAPARELEKRGLCDSSDGPPSRLTCGGFALKDDRGIPIIIYSSEWLGFSNENKIPLLTKVYRMMIESLVFEKKDHADGHG